MCFHQRWLPAATPIAFGTVFDASTLVAKSAAPVAECALSMFFVDCLSSDTRCNFEKCSGQVRSRARNRGENVSPEEVSSWALAQLRFSSAHDMVRWACNLSPHRNALDIRHSPHEQEQLRHECCYACDLTPTPIALAAHAQNILQKTGHCVHTCWGPARARSFQNIFWRSHAIPELPMRFCNCLLFSFLYEPCSGPDDDKNMCSCSRTSRRDWPKKRLTVQKTLERKRPQWHFAQRHRG